LTLYLCASLEEEFCENADSIIRSSHFMANCARVCIDFMVVAAWLALITEEMKFIKVFLNELQTIALIPALRENIKGDLATNRKGQVITKLSSQFFYKGLTNICLMIILFKFVTLLS